MTTSSESVPTAGARRMRWYRERRRRGLTCIKVDLRRSEVDALIARGLLKPAERQDRSALAAALHRYLDEKPYCRTPTVTRNADTVTCHSTAGFGSARPSCLRSRLSLATTTRRRAHGRTPRHVRGQVFDGSTRYREAGVEPTFAANVDHQVP
jgi:hypothetical protein